MARMTNDPKQLTRDTNTNISSESSSPVAVTTNRQILMRWQIRIFALSWISYAAFYFPRNAISAAKVGILDDGVISRAGLGYLDSAYLAAYAVGQFVWGAMAERYGQRVVVAGGMAFAAITALLMGIIPALWLFMPLMVVQGLAQSTGWSSLCKNMATFFTIGKRGRAMGFFSTSYAFGGLVAVPIMGWVAYTIFDSWRWTFYCGAAVMLLVLVLFLIFQRNSPEEVGLPGIDENQGKFDETYRHRPSGTRAPVPVVKVPAEKFQFRDLLAAARHDSMVLRLGIVYFMIKPARYAILLWGPVMVVDAMPGVDKITAIMVPVTFGLAGVAAPIAIGWLSDTIFKGRRIPPSVISLLGLVVALALWQPATSLGSIPVIAILLGVIGLTAYAADAMMSGIAAVDFGTSKYAAGATGFINGCGSIGAILGGLLPGLLPGAAVFYIFAGTALIAAIILIPSWNKRPATT